MLVATCRTITPQQAEDMKLNLQAHKTCISRTVDGCAGTHLAIEAPEGIYVFLILGADNVFITFDGRHGECSIDPARYFGDTFNEINDDEWVAFECHTLTSHNEFIELPFLAHPVYIVDGATSNPTNS